MNTTSKIVCAILSVAALAAGAAAQGPPKPLIITKNTTLSGVTINTPIIIDADDIKIDGAGAHLVGPGRPGKLEQFTGVGIYSKGRKNIVLKNIKVSGFRRGLHLEDTSGWKIEKCDFSGNYHNPEYGWGDYDRVGGMILDRVSDTSITECKARENWNGIDLFQSNKISIKDSDASHCSNVCLKLEQSSDNHVANCNLSYGIRISPGEVHARDSTCVLIESGSNDNHFYKNDITHGGDGVFIRVLNGWMSTGNSFTENDCSYANNNGFESWSAGNTYYKNKANYCSYGFWLGGSDHTILKENEAAFNGTDRGYKNAPESDFGHGGIVIVHGTGTHTVIDGNYCHDNAGGGIVFRGDLATRGAKWKMYHLIIENNRLENNKWGIFGRFADWIDLSGNTFKNNEKDEHFEEVTNISRREGNPKNVLPKVAISPSTVSKVKILSAGNAIELESPYSKDREGGDLQYQWKITNGNWRGDAIATYETPKIRHVFQYPGIYRVGLSVHNGSHSVLDWLDCYVREDATEIGTEGALASWSIDLRDINSKAQISFDRVHRFVGMESLKLTLDPFHGGDVELRLSGADGKFDLSNTESIHFWLRFRNANIAGFNGPQPIVSLQSGEGSFVYTPVFNYSPRNLLMDLPYAEAREGWLRVSIPLAGSSEWKRAEVFEGAILKYYHSNLEFETIDTPVENQQSAALTTTGKILFLAKAEGEQLYRSDDGGKTWREMKNPSSLGGSPGDWMTGMLVYDSKHFQQGALFSRRNFEDANNSESGKYKLIAYDIAKDEWRQTPTPLSMSHGLAVAGRYLYGIAHARMGNYGGAICRVSLDPYKTNEERTMLDFTTNGEKIADADWYSRAAQFCEANGKIYGIKNDWTTPQPQDETKNGDILFYFDPGLFKSSIFAGGDPDDTQKWREVRTPAHVVARLPFETGHGAGIAEVPANWCEGIGKKGGLFILAGNSPSNHEGWGTPSKQFALLDIETAKFTVGELPGETGSGSALTFHDGNIMIKRGGTNAAKSNRELWIARPLAPDKFKIAQSAQEKRRVNLSNIESLQFRFESAGGKPVQIWIDHLTFEPKPKANK
ncbi:MAG: right-handed parallel beta-helix repeat-containing protein [Planctomycetota bacterium]